MTELAAAIINRLERMDAASGKAVRRAAYALYAAAGVDVAKLAKEVRDDEALLRQRRTERSFHLLARREERAARIPELQARVMQRPAEQAKRVRAMLAAHTMVDGRKVSTHKVDDIAVQLGVDRAFIRAVRELDQARAARASLTDERKALPARHQRRLDRLLARPTWDGPTRERVRQAGGQKPTETKMAGGLTSSRFEWPIDEIRSALTEPEYLAADRLRTAFDAMGGRSSIGGYGGLAGGSDPTRKLGLTPTQEFAIREYRELWNRAIGQSTRFVLMNFVLQVGWAGAERPLIRVEFGRRFGRESDLNEKQARGVADGAIITACSVLADASRNYGNWIAEQRRLANRFVGELDVLSLIGAGEPQDLAQAIQLVASRSGVEGWIAASCVHRANRDMGASYAAAR